VSQGGDQSHIPPVLRGLRKCEACGFPISAGRTLCVECEEKKWRGQLKPQARGGKPSPPTATVRISTSAAGISAAAPSLAKSETSLPSSEPSSTVLAATLPLSISPAHSEQTVAGPAVDKPSTQSAQTPELVLSAGLEPSRSWLSTNRYIVLALLVTAIAVAGFVLLR